MWASNSQPVERKKFFYRAHFHSQKKEEIDKFLLKRKFLSVLAPHEARTWGILDNKSNWKKKGKSCKKKFFECMLFIPKRNFPFSWCCSCFYTIDMWDTLNKNIPYALVCTWKILSNFHLKGVIKELSKSTHSWYLFLFYERFKVYESSWIIVVWLYSYYEWNNRALPLIYHSHSQHYYYVLDNVVPFSSKQHIKTRSFEADKLHEADEERKKWKSVSAIFYCFFFLHALV